MCKVHIVHMFFVIIYLLIGDYRLVYPQIHHQQQRKRDRADDHNQLAADAWHVSSDLRDYLFTGPTN